MNQDWFEMKDVRRRKLDGQVWIPLRAVNKIVNHVEYGYLGFKEEFFGAGTVAIPIDSKKAAEELTWDDIGIDHDNSGCIQDGYYIPSDIYDDYRGECNGLYLVLVQRTNRDEVREWHLHQDFVITLGLKREGDVWLCPDEGYTEVAHLLRRTDNSPYLLEVRAEHLKDYLCARNMGIYVTSYRIRDAILEDASIVTWAENPFFEHSEGDRWEGRVIEIHEGGHPFGSEVAVFHSARTDVDEGDDVPVLEDPTDGNIKSDSWVKKFEGKKLYRIQGEFWRNEWIEPAATSPRIKGDKQPPTVFFITDAEGNRENKDTLRDGGRWLWFRPDVIMALAHRRGGSLSWYTKNTGSISCSPDYDVHFGVNQLGLVNVYAKDVVLLPEWQQRIWAAYNVGPDGGVSEELLDSQVKAAPANTQAPESFLQTGIELINHLAKEQLGFALFREHEQIPTILTKIHRFRSVDNAGLYSLAKDLARLTADSLDAVSMQKIVCPPKGTKWGSLKTLENLLASKIDPSRARGLLTPLVGIYELRLADAHLPSSEIDEALQMARVDQTLPLVYQGEILLHSCVSSLYGIADVLKTWGMKPL